MVKINENRNIGIGYYSSNGTWQSYKYYINGVPVTISSSINHIIISLPVGYSSAATYSNLKLYKLD